MSSGDDQTIAGRWSGGGATEEVSAPAAERRGVVRRSDLLIPVASWSIVAAIVVGVQLGARRLVQPTKSGRFLDGLVQFDGPEYLRIITDGYQQRQLVWFPLYPLLARAFDSVAGSPTVAAVVVSMAAGLVASVAFWVWSGRSGMSSLARRISLAVVLVYPYGWFLYGVVYPDALFLAMVLLAFTQLERQRVWAAAMFGALATASRPSGFAVGLGLWVLWLERTGVLVVPSERGLWRHALAIPSRLELEKLSPASFIPLLSMTGLAGFMTYQWVWWGSPWRFVSEQGNYHEQGVSSLLKQQYFDAWSSGFDGRHLATTTAQALILIVVLGSVPAVGRRFGWGYAVYVLGLVALPMVSVSTFMGVGRYLLPAFPAFALAGEWLTRRSVSVRLVWFVLSGGAMLLMVFGFSRSWYLT
jgi:hypothetical protein